MILKKCTVHISVMKRNLLNSNKHLINVEYKDSNPSEINH